MRLLNPKEKCATLTHMESNALWPQGPDYKGESIQTDALCLAHFVRAPRGALCADLGTGCGILPLLLLRERDDLRFHAVELRESAAQTAKENMERNGFAEHCSVYIGDAREAPLERGKYDLVVSNPPYFPADASCGDEERKTMRQESMSLSELCALASGLLKNGGRFTLCYPASRFAELTVALEAAKLRVKRLRCVQHSAHHAPSLLLCESRKNAGAGLQWEPPLLIRREDGAETEEYKKICHWE